MTNPLGDLTADDFLRDNWQQHPLLIRQAFPGFVPELDTDDIAGLACEEMAEARLISGSYPEHDWTLRYGPFTEAELSSLPGENWTLLVQDIEKHYPPLRSLLSSFSFLPSWRMDDLMISVAAQGGSVGPHVDQYDVFLLQASGRRRWQTARSFNPDLLPGCELKVLQSFEAEQEWVLEAGDMLYLPPGVAHHGVALDLGMTWSIGMRAPSSADLLQALGEWLARHGDEGDRYRDSKITAAHKPGELDDAALEGFSQMIVSAARDKACFQAFMGSFLSQYRLAHEPAAPEQQISPAALLEALRNGAQLHHNPWTRLLWLATKNGALLFAAGDEFTCSADLAPLICRNPVSLPVEGPAHSEALDLAARLLNKGHLYLDYPENQD